MSRWPRSVRRRRLRARWDAFAGALTGVARAAGRAAWHLRLVRRRVRLLHQVTAVYLEEFRG